MPFRVSHVAFSSDGSYLVVSAEQGGGLAVYSTESLLQGSTTASLELSTQGTALRAILPNPAEASSHLVACVTTQGDLLIADLKQRSFLSGQNGHTLIKAVSSVAWSSKGKQLVAGLGDGKVTQITPTGEVKAQLPLPPGTEPNEHGMLDSSLVRYRIKLNLGIVSSLIWLQNDVFIIILTPWASQGLGSPGRSPPSKYFLVTRVGDQYSHQRLVDPCPPYGIARAPAKHFIARLQSAPPSLDDVLFVSSTVSSDVSLFVKARTPLSTEPAAANGINKYVTAQMADDSRRAQMPLTQDLTDTSPIGAALDFSPEEKVARPIPGDELDESLTPLPAYYILNTDGVLVGWWFVYNEAVRTGVRYPGSMAAAATPSLSQGAIGSERSANQPASTNPFGQVSTTNPTMTNPQSSLAQNPFASNSTSIFGQPSTSIGGSKSPWGTATTQSMASATVPAFGSASNLGSAGQSAFGSAATLGTNKSPWASSQGITLDTPSAAVVLSGNDQATTLALKKEADIPSGFASHASAGGFAAFSSSQSNQGQNIFGSLLPASSSGPGEAKTAWNNPSATEGSSFGGAFKLQSAFVRQPSPEKQDTRTEEKPETKSLFGSSFSEALKPVSDTTEKKNTSPPEGTIPSSDESKVTQPAKSAPDSSVERSAPAKTENNPPPRSPKEASEPSPIDIPAAPLPPDPSSKVIYGPGDSSGSSDQETPLPAVKHTQHEAMRAESPPTDGIQTTLSREGSGVMVYPPTEASNSNVSEINKSGNAPETIESLPDSTTPITSPATSGSLSGSFEEIERSPSVDQSEAMQSRLAMGKKPLFGEIGLSTTPFLPPTQPVVSSSPRSPSPVRIADRDQQVDRASSARAQSLLERQYLDKAKPEDRGQGRRAMALMRHDMGSTVSVSSSSSDIRREGNKPQQKGGDEDENPDGEEDRLVRAELEAEIVSTQRLVPFIAHHDYVGHVSKEGIPGQIERVCRDISSMIDTIGLNARGIRAWTDGHEQYKERGRQLEDLANLHEDEWVMVEASDLGLLIDGDLHRGISDHISPDWQAQVYQLRGVEADLQEIISQGSRFLQLLDPTSSNGSKDRATDPQFLQKADLRKGLRDLQTLLVDAEQNVALLQAKMTAIQSNSRNERASPSVDAVVRTITKMMKMVEAKSVDIDVLEQQMRGVHIGSVTPNPNGSPSYLRDSAYTTNASFRSSIPSRDTASDPNGTSTSGFRGSQSTRSLSTNHSHAGSEQDSARRISIARNRLRKQKQGFKILQKIVRASPANDIHIE